MTIPSSGSAASPKPRLSGSALTVFLTLIFATSLALPTQFAKAQAVGGGQIQGIVTDATGAPVPGATVQSTQINSGQERQVVSGGDGGYFLPNLPVGPYQIRVTKTGFEAYNQSGIVIEVGNNLRVDVQLKVGGAAETVQVNADASMVQTEDQSVSQVIDAQRVIDLPLNGRQATQLILLGPAAAQSQLPATTLVPRTIRAKRHSPSPAARARRLNS